MCASVHAYCAQRCISRDKKEGGMRWLGEVLLAWQWRGTFWPPQAPPSPVDLLLLEGAAIGGGGSGAAAGLLHPFSPRGKVLWKGVEAMEAAKQLLAVAEAAREAHSAESPHPPFVWWQPFLRPATSEKQAADFQKVAGPTEGSVTSRAVGVEEALRVVPGLCVPWVPPKSNAAKNLPAALLVDGGCVIDPVVYLDALWAACQQKASVTQSQATLLRTTVDSLADLEQSHGPFTAVVAAAGAATSCIKELDGVLPMDLVQGYTLDLCAPAGTPVPQPQPHCLPGTSGDLQSSPSWSASGSCSADSTSRINLRPSPAPTLTASPSSDAQPQSFPKGRDLHDDSGAPQFAQGHDLHEESGDPQRLVAAPLLDLGEEARGEAACGDGSGNVHSGVEQHAGCSSLLGAVYLAGKGPRERVVGATKRGGLTPAEALRECGRHVEEGLEWDFAVDALLPQATALWGPADAWDVVRVRTGVRALPPRTHEGSLPLAGRLQTSRERWWVVAGLGARGLVYHAWLGQLLAHAILEDDEALLPPELLRWKRTS
eukprot:jgi/Botrbrau1/2431/Bobra.0395s0053.1